MSEASRRSSRVTITLGRSGQVVSRDGCDLELEGGTKRSVKERLGNQLDSDAVTKRQRGEASFSGNDLQISQSDLRFKLLQRNAQRRTQSDSGSSMDLREKLLSKSEQPPPPRSLDSRPRMAEPRDDRLPPLRTSRGHTQMLSSSSNYSPRTLDDIGRRSPERLVVSSSRGRSPPRNTGSISGTPRDLTPPRNTRSFSGDARDALSPPRNAGRRNGYPRDLSPPRNTRSFSGGSRADLSPPRHAGRISSHSRDLSPPRHSGRMSGQPRDLSPPRHAGRISSHSRDLSPPRHAERINSHPRDLSPPRHAGRISSHPRDLSVSPLRNSGRTVDHPRDQSPLRDAGRVISHPRDQSPLRDAGRTVGHPRHLSPPRTAGRTVGYPRDLSPPRNASNFSSSYRTMSPTRNVGSSYMSSSRGFSPPRNPGSYMGSSMGSPPSRRMDDFTGRSRMLDDVRASPYGGVSGVPNSQAIANGATYSRPMLPPPVPNPYPLPPLSQLPPFGSIMQNSFFPVEEPVTVDSFLDSLGLGRYSLAFKREEVDMNTIKQMKESDLKDLTIPMGPRKRILQAIACLPRQ
ncbi:Sterile alpha motif [Hirschfeldia incana]|nr:Sterile alpha motif [Hirschfeldia incana]KAJ0231928.1 Sterile alpha motif [Hirschfeldia incana]